MYSYSTEHLESLPTISRSQDADLKIDAGGMRVWLSRMTKEDGAEHDHEVTVERYELRYADGAWGRAWLTVARYSGDRWYRLVDTWNGGTLDHLAVWEGCHPDGAFVWIHDHTPFSYTEALAHQGYRLDAIR